MKKLLAICIVIILLVSLCSGCLEEEKKPNAKPVVDISNPSNGATVSSLVMISGSASDADGEEDLKQIEVRIDTGTWHKAQGTILWNFDWDTYDISDGLYTITVRAYDGKTYSKEQIITLQVDNPENVESESHKWALFIAAANFPEDNKSKLGNGGLYLAEEMVAYFIEQLQYATSNIILLFDDGWIRKDNGYGEKYKTLQERKHEYAITYGGATRENVERSLNHLINQSNQYRDSEVFIWIYNHGYGDLNNSLTGGKILKSSHIFIWDDIVSEKQLGKLLAPLKSTKVTLLVDACYCGGFADKTILNLPTSLLFRSGIPRLGRVVITGASKFRKGYASTTQGPLFTNLWFEGLVSGDADGFKQGFLKMGRPSLLRLFKDGKVSVEEAFYYARYKLRTDEDLKEFQSMEPQINDRYPAPGILLSRRGLILGED